MGDSSRRRRRVSLRVALVCALAGAAAAILPGSGSSASVKPFTAAISPSAAGAGGSNGYTYTLTDANQSGVPSSQPLGSADISIPSGWTVSSLSAAGPSGTSWSASVNASTGQIELRSATQSDRLAGGQSVTVRFVGTAPCTGGGASWTPVVRQSNQFLGSGNDFSLDGSVPTVVVSAGSGPLGSFRIASITSPQTAGTSFSVQATALDVCGNVKTDYAGGATLGGTLSSSPTAPAGDTTAPSYGAFGSWVNGSSSASVTAKKAETGRSLTVTDGAATGSSNLFDVRPGPLGSFTVGQVGSPQHAGVSFVVQATAYDVYGNAKTDYAGGATLTGTLTSSTAAPPGGSIAPSYGSFAPWANGSSSATVTAKNAETGRSLTVTDGAATGSSNLFDVQPGTLIPSFGAEPADAQVSTTIYSSVLTQAPVAVAVADAYGNIALDGTTVSMVGPAGLHGTLSNATAGGVASFGNLSIGAIGTYQLTAQVGSITATSTPFQVVTQLKICSAVTQCEVTASSSAQSSDATITSAGGTMFQNVVLTTSFLTNPNECGGFTPITGTVGVSAEVNGSAGNVSTSQPGFSITYTVTKATLKAAHLDNLGASQFNVCLGAKRFTGSGAWVDKFGKPATLDPATGFYWGLVPARSGSLPPMNPYLASEHKDGAGNLIIVLVKPYPWDGWAYI